MEESGRDRDNITLDDIKICINVLNRFTEYYRKSIAVLRRIYSEYGTSDKDMFRAILDEVIRSYISSKRGEETATETVSEEVDEELLKRIRDKYKK